MWHSILKQPNKSMRWPSFSPSPQSTKHNFWSVPKILIILLSVPELLVNSEGFDFGTKQNGEKVSDVVLPVWARGSPRLFIKIHRQALESEHVRGNRLSPAGTRTQNFLAIVSLANSFVLQPLMGFNLLIPSSFFFFPGCVHSHSLSNGNLLDVC